MSVVDTLTVVRLRTPTLLGCDETSSPQIPTSCRRYCGSACDGPHCASASLSDRAGAPHCRLSRRRHERHPCAPDRRVAFQAIRPLVRGRPPARGSPRDLATWHRCRVRSGTGEGGGLRSSRADTRTRARSALASREYYDSMGAAFSASLAST